MQQKYLMDLQLGSVLTVPSKVFESHSVDPTPTLSGFLMSENEPFFFSLSLQSDVLLWLVCFSMNSSTQMHSSSLTETEKPPWHPSGLRVGIEGLETAHLSATRGREVVPNL